MNILLADGDASTRERLQAKLQKQGHDVVSVGDGGKRPAASAWRRGALDCSDGLRAAQTRWHVSLQEDPGFRATPLRLYRFAWQRFTFR